MSWEFPVVALVVLVLALYWGLRGAAASGPPRRRVQLGVSKGRLEPCPDRPNCVSSQASPDDRVHYVPPIPYRGTVPEMRDRLLTVLEGLRRVVIVELGTDYIRAEFRTRVIGLVDDVEFYLPYTARNDTGVIQFRSASRVGNGDLGLNRRRYQLISRLVQGETQE